MIRHIVMFKFLENAEGRTKKENLEIAANMLKDTIKEEYPDAKMTEMSGSFSLTIFL